MVAGKLNMSMCQFALSVSIISITTINIMAMNTAENTMTDYKNNFYFKQASNTIPLLHADSSYLGFDSQGH